MFHLKLLKAFLCNNNRNNSSLSIDISAKHRVNKS